MLPLLLCLYQQLCFTLLSFFNYYFFFVILATYSSEETKYKRVDTWLIYRYICVLVRIYMFATVVLLECLSNCSKRERKKYKTKDNNNNKKNTKSNSSLEGNLFQLLQDFLVLISLVPHHHNGVAHPA